VVTPASVIGDDAANWFAAALQARFTSSQYAPGCRDVGMEIRSQSYVALTFDAASSAA
jgi:hypothetical protein